MGTGRQTWRYIEVERGLSGDLPMGGDDGRLGRISAGYTGAWGL